MSRCRCMGLVLESVLTVGEVVGEGVGVGVGCGLGFVWR